MTINTKITEQDYTRLMFTITYRKPIMIFLSIIGLLNLTLGALVAAGVNIPTGDMGAYPTLIFGLIITLVLPFSVYSSSKKAFAGHLRLHEQIAYTFNNEKIITAGESFNSELDWSKVFKIEELKQFFIIYQTPQAVNLIPKASLTGLQQNELRSILRSVSIAGTKKLW